MRKENEIKNINVPLDKYILIYLEGERWTCERLNVSALEALGLYAIFSQQHINEKLKLEAKKAEEPA